jgi:hypothetical protein
VKTPPHAFAFSCEEPVGKPVDAEPADGEALDFLLGDTKNTSYLITQKQIRLKNLYLIDSIAPHIPSIPQFRDNKNKGTIRTNIHWASLIIQFFIFCLLINS